MESKKKLKQLLSIVVDEMDKNPEFANKIENLFLGDNYKHNTKRTRQPAVLNPLELLTTVGEEELYNELLKLDIEQLKDIIAQYSMDPSKLALKWKKPERLIKHIIEMSHLRTNKGNAFRED